MSTFRNPVGPQSPQVYWRRRLVLGLGLLAVVIIVILIIVRPGADANTPKPPPTTSADTSSTDEAPQEEGKACNPANIAVKAITDKGEYVAGEQPLMSLSVVNNGAVACVMNVGTTQQLFEITSGSESYWKSTDCQSAPVDLDQVLEPGVALTTESIPWDRTRSDPTTCANERSAVTAGGATYHLTVSLGEIKSEATAPFLLY